MVLVFSTFQISFRTNLKTERDDLISKSVQYSKKNLKYPEVP